MTGTTQWIAYWSLLINSAVFIGCQSAPPGTTPAEVRAVTAQTVMASNIDADNAVALAQLEKSSSAAGDAVAAIQKAYDVAANNLANAQTTAFKGSRAVLQEGGKVRIQRDFSQGHLESTGRNLDLGIDGPGFFRIKADNVGGVGYTRNGNFFVNKDGEMVLGLGDGYILSPPVVIPRGTTDIIVCMDGRVEILKSKGAAKTVVAQIKLHTFMNPDGLKNTVGGIFLETETSGSAADNIPGLGGAGRLFQGYLEASNVDTTREMTRLVLLTRWREALLRAMGVK